MNDQVGIGSVCEEPPVRRGVAAEYDFHAFVVDDVAARPSARVGSENAKLVQLFRSHQATVARLARLQALNFVRGRLTSEQGEIRDTSQFEVQILFEQKVDKTSERNRLNKEKEKLEGELRQVKGQLANNQFRERAPRQVVEAAEQKHSDCESKYRKVVETLERLG